MSVEMLSTTLSTGVAIGAAIFSLVCLVITLACLSVARSARREAYDYRSIILHVQELEDQHEALSASHKRLRSRIGMRELRDRKRNGGDSAPEPESIDEWKKRKRQELHLGPRTKGR